MAASVLDEMLSYPPQNQGHYLAGGVGSSVGNVAPHVSPLEPRSSQDQAFATMSGRKQACHLCRQRKRKCDAKLPSCSGCIKNGTECVYVKITNPSTDGSQTSHLFGNGNAQSHDYFVPCSAATATWTSTPTQPSTEANVSTFPASVTWNLDFMPDFFSQPVMLSPLAASDQTFAPISAPLQVQSSNADGRQPTESIRSTPNGSHGSPSFLEMRKMTSESLQSAKRALANTPSEESLFRQFHVQSSPDLEGFSRPSRNFANLSDGTSSTGTTAMDSHRSGDVLSTMSANPPEQGKPHYPANLPKARKTSHTNESLVPSDRQVLELLEIFFTDYHHFLPCIHQKSFSDRIKRRGSMESDPLLLAILAVAAPAHSDHQILSLRNSWLARAKHLFDKDLNYSTLPTQSLQTAAWIVFCAYISGDLTEAWFFLGKACRLAHFLGFDRVDCGRRERLISMAPQTRDAIELEERRKTVWVLFFLDRSLSCLAGFSLAIDDRQFHVNFPIDDVQFQAVTHSDQLSQLPSDPFTTDLAILISLAAIRHFDSKVSYNHILRASVLLGRIMTLHSHLHISRDRTEYVIEFEKLANAVSLFYVALSRKNHEYREPTGTEPTYNLWLTATVQTCNILLHHPGVPQPEIDERQEHIENTSAYLRCLNAARQTLGIMKELAQRSPDALVNPFLVTIYFLCGRFLSIAWHEDKNQIDRDGIDFLLLLVGVVAERWASLAQKFRKGIMRDLGKSDEETKSMKVGTGCYLDTECV